MPNFEDMQKMQVPTTIGSQLKEMSNIVMNDTFSNSTNYRMGKIYDCNLKELTNIDFKFTKYATYTVSKDQVEYHVQFRPGVNPEIDFENLNIFPDKKHRLNYYLDILDENTKVMEKWLILGKDTNEFDRYIVLKCNWVLEWIDENHKYHSCLGVVRDRNNYNSGVNKVFYTHALLCSNT